MSDTKGMYETGGFISGFGLGASASERSLRVEGSAALVSDANTGNPDTYAHPSTNWSPANPNRDAVSDSNFGTDYARRGVYRDWGGSARNPCLGRQWAADLGGYRQTRRGPHQFTGIGLPPFVH